MQHIPASTLNSKFGLDSPSSDHTDDEDPTDTYYHENSNARYYDGGH